MNRPPLAHKVRIDYTYHDATTHEADPNAFRDRMIARRQIAQAPTEAMKLGTALHLALLERKG